MNANLDIDKLGPLYQIIGAVRIPQGRITLDDRFVIEDVFDMKNSLDIKTPFVWASEINSMYIFKVDMMNSVYLMDMALNVIKNDSIPLFETGITGNYSYVEGEEDDSKSHALHLIFKTPYSFLGHVDTRGILEFDENIFKTNIILRTNDSQADFVGSIEMEEAFMDGSFTVRVDSPALKIPKTKVNVKKDFTEVEKRLECGIQMGEYNDHCQLYAAWDLETLEHTKIHVALETWIVPLKNVEFDVAYDNNLVKNESAILMAKFKYFPEQEYQLIGAYRTNDTIDIELHGPIGEHGFDYRFDGALETANKITGRLLNLRTNLEYNIDGAINIENGQGNMKIEGRTIANVGEEHIITLTIIREQYGLQINIRNNTSSGSVSINYVNALNWNADIKAEYLAAGLEEQLEMKIYDLRVFTSAQVNGNTSIHLSAKTPWQEFEDFQVDGNVMLDTVSGNAKLKHHLNERHGHLSLGWKLVYMQDMFIHLSGGTNDKDVDLSFFFVNPKRAFRNANIGFDVNVDNDKWRCGTNASIGYKNMENIDVVIAVRLPPPNNDDHRILVNYHGNKGIQDANFVVGYNAAKAMINYGADGSVSIFFFSNNNNYLMTTHFDFVINNVRGENYNLQILQIRMAEKNLDAHLRLAWSDLPINALKNFLNVTFDQQRINLKYSLYTPKFINEETVAVIFNYDASLVQRSVIDADLYYPARQHIGAARISYTSLSNVNGTVNVTTSIARLPYAACNFIVLTTL